MTPAGWLTAALPAVLAWAGLLAFVSARPRRPRLTDRVEPYLRDLVPATARLAPGARAAPGARRGRGQRRVPGRLPDAAQLGQRLARLADAAVGGRDSVRRRLGAAGAEVDLDAFRLQQVLAAATGVCAGFGLLALRLATGVGLPPASGLGLAVLLGGAGFTGRDLALSRAARRRRAVLLAELPAVVDLLALAVAAGETPVGALTRIARGTGALAGELTATLAEVRAGRPLADALTGLSDRCDVTALGRLTDAITISLARGTPLADVLRAQAQDARDAARRGVLEAGARTEIAMLIPVVFLLLPVMLVVALYPAAVTLTTLAR